MPHKGVACYTTADARPCRPRPAAHSKRWPALAPAVDPSPHRA